MYGLFAALLVFMFVTEPERGRYDPNKQNVKKQQEELEREVIKEALTSQRNDETFQVNLTQAEIESVEAKPNVCCVLLKGIVEGLVTLVTNPCTRLLLLGNLTLSISQFIFSYSLTTYFNFYHQESLYAVLNSFNVMFGGCTSCLVIGAIANKIDKNKNADLRSKSYISTGMCLIAVPLCFMLFLIQEWFSFSVIILFIYDLCCLGYYAPVMSMIQGTIPPEKKGAAIGAFGFANNMTQALASAIIGVVVTKNDLTQNQKTFGLLCAFMTGIPNLIAGLCFFLGGIPYKRLKEEQI